MRHRFVATILAAVCCVGLSNTSSLEVVPHKPKMSPQFLNQLYQQQQGENQERRPSLAVIGYGVAGYAIVTRAIKLGYRVTIFERESDALRGTSSFFMKMHNGLEYPHHLQSAESCHDGQLAWRQELGEDTFLDIIGTTSNKAGARIMTTSNWCGVQPSDMDDGALDATYKHLQDRC